MKTYLNLDSEMKEVMVLYEKTLEVKEKATLVPRWFGASKWCKVCDTSVLQ